MPKIVDREARKKEIVEQAIGIFREHGYTGLGMRRIAEELGVSKSALYHYFPSKEALFAACTEAVSASHAPSTAPDTHAPATPGAIAEAVVAIGRRMDDEFGGELSLMVDYLRGRSDDEIAADPTMAVANARALDTLRAVAGDAHAEPTLCLLYGWLLQRWLDGRRTDEDALRRWVQQLVS